MRQTACPAPACPDNIFLLSARWALSLSVGKKRERAEEVFSCRGGMWTSYLEKWIGDVSDSMNGSLCWVCTLKCPFLTQWIKRLNEWMNEGVIWPMGDVKKKNTGGRMRIGAHRWSPMCNRVRPRGQRSQPQHKAWHMVNMWHPCCGSGHSVQPSIEARGAGIVIQPFTTSPHGWLLVPGVFYNFPTAVQEGEPLCVSDNICPWRMLPVVLCLPHYKAHGRPLFTD